MTATIEEIDISHLFDFNLECGWYDDIPYQSCDNPATHIILIKCCKVSRPVCNQHLESFHKYIFSIMMGGARTGSKHIKCEYCKTRFHMLDIEQWYDIQPI